MYSLRTVLIIVITAASISAGNGKVGSSVINATNTPSVASAGMACLGVTRWTDDWSPYANPATLAYAECEYASWTGYPSGTYLWPEYSDLLKKSSALTFSASHLLSSVPGLSAAFSYQRTSMVESFEEVTYEGSTTYTFKNVDQRYSFGVGYSHDIDVAAGVSYVRMTSSPSSPLDLGHQIAIGLIARSPVIGDDMIEEAARKFYGRFAIGVEWSMLGTGTYYTVSEFAAPSQTRLGIGLELGYAWLQMYPAAEFEKWSGDDSRHWRYGAELSAFNIVSVRGGYVSEPDWLADVTTYGITLSSLGITKRLASKATDENAGLGDYLLRHLNVKFSFANLSSKDGWYPDGVKYYAVSVSL